MAFPAWFDLVPGVEPAGRGVVEVDSMSEPSRRRFLGLCASAAALVSVRPSALAASDKPLRAYPRVLLCDAEGEPVRCEDLVAEREYVFHYPYRSTPCFLIDLGKAVDPGVTLETREGREYRWQGGVGPQRSVVAYSAICAHKMTHPSPAVSFIGYRSEPVGYVNRDKEVERRAAVIQCCSEHSVYDPAAGARVISGPAPEPLAAIALEVEGDGRLYARGVYGGDMFDPFFEAFGFRLQMEMDGADPRQVVAERTEVVPIDRYTAKRIACS